MAPVSPWPRRIWLFLAALLALAAVARHASMQWDAWQTKARGFGFDFASFHYAAKVASDGEDPYQTRNLNRAAKAEGTRGRVHPFFYPPPALLMMAWNVGMPLADAYWLWFWLDEACALLAMLVLWRWWRPLGPAVPVALFATLAYLTAFHDNHVMGQVNLPILLISLLGLWAADRGRPGLGGALVGIACMAKMAPALFVVDALLRRRWRFVGGAVAMAVGLSLAAIGAYGWGVTERFYTEVFPGFSDGEYNGLKVPITLWANHSIPNVWVEAFPADARPWRVLSDTARLGSRAMVGTMLLLAIASSLKGGADTLAVALRTGGVGIVMLLVPLYTYEHHIVWAWPAAVASLAALSHGRVPKVLGIVWIAAFAVWCVDLRWWNEVFDDLPPDDVRLRWFVREGKMLALMAFGTMCAWGLWTAPAVPEDPTHQETSR